MKSRHIGRSCAAPGMLQVSLVSFLLVISGSVEIRAQESDFESRSACQTDTPRDSDYRLMRGDNEFGVWGAGSFEAPTPIGSTYRPIAIVGLRYGRVVGTNRLGTLEYVADLIPMQIVFDRHKNGRGDDQGVFGIGINYGGVKVSYLRRSRLKPFVGGSGGFIIYTRPVPLQARRLNFTYSLDAGIDIFTGKKRALTIGYKFYHASDAVNTRANIGTNDNMVSIGFSFFR